MMKRRVRGVPIARRMRRQAGPGIVLVYGSNEHHNAVRLDEPAPGPKRHFSERHLHNSLVLEMLNTWTARINEGDLLAALEAFDFILSARSTSPELPAACFDDCLNSLAFLFARLAFEQDGPKTEIRKLRKEAHHRALDELRWKAVCTALQGAGGNDRDPYVRAAAIHEQDGYPRVAARTMRKSFLDVQRRLPFRQNVLRALKEIGRSARIEKMTGAEDDAPSHPDEVAHLVDQVESFLPKEIDGAFSVLRALVGTGLVASRVTGRRATRTNRMATNKPS